jgi:hypothetical protein
MSGPEPNTSQSVHLQSSRKTKHRKTYTASPESILNPGSNWLNGLIEEVIDAECLKLEQMLYFVTI